MQYEEVPPTRESNALIGGLLTVDENRADVQATRGNAEKLIDYDAENFDENMLLNLEGIGIFGDDFSKKIEEEITEEPPEKTFPKISGNLPDDVTQRFFESGMRADPNDPDFNRNINIRRRFRPRLKVRPGRMQTNQQQQQQLQQQQLKKQQQQQIYVSDYESGFEIGKGAASRGGGGTLATLDRRPNRPSFHHMGPPPGELIGRHTTYH